MVVVLRDCASGFYYAGPERWAGAWERALDLGSVERAAEMAARFGPREMEVVAWPDEPERTWAIPVKGYRDWLGGDAISWGRNGRLDLRRKRAA